MRNYILETRLAGIIYIVLGGMLLIQNTVPIWFMLIMLAFGSLLVIVSFNSKFKAWTRK